MKTMKRILPIVLVLVLCLSMAACGGTVAAPSGGDSQSSSGTQSTTGNQPSGAPQPSAAGEKYADHIEVIIDNTQIAGINPIGAGGPGSATGWVYLMVYNSLVSFDDNTGVYSPNLATSWESDDWQTVTFHLRDDVVFSNGEKFTADDVVFTIEQSIANPGSVAGSTFSSVESAVALDPYTVVFTLKAPKPQILFDCSSELGGIMCKKAVEEDPDKGVWIGTGPFIITDFGTNDFVKLERNDLYWGDPVPTKSMTLRYIPEMSTRLMMLQNGEADICFNLSEQDMDLVAADPEHYDVYAYLANNCSDIGFNLNDPICGDINFRMAVACALNRTDIALGAAGTYAAPETTGTFWGSGTPFRNNDIPIIPYDLQKAKDYLAASPYKGEEIELITAIPTMINASTVIQNQLAEIGINIKIKQTDPGSLMSICSYGTNDYQMYAFVGAFGYEPYSAMNGIYGQAHMQNRATYDEPRILEILDMVATETDPAKLQAYCYEVQEIEAKDIPYINLFYVKQAIAASKAIGGLVVANDGGHDLRYMYKLEG